MTFTAGMFNRLASLRQQVRAAWSDIDAQPEGRPPHVSFGR